MRRKIYTFIFIFLLVVGSFYLSQSIFHLDLFIINPLLGKLKALDLTCRGHYRDQGRQSLPDWNVSQV